MKKVYFTVLLLIFNFAQYTLGQNAAINSTGTAPDASAMLDVSSTTKGLLTPRMTAVQRAAITSPATGLIVYQTDGTDGFYYYDGSTWLMLDNGTSIPDQSVYGAKLKFSTISSSTTLTSSDYNVIVNGNYTVSLPSSPNDGDVIWIFCTTAGASLNTNGKAFQVNPSTTWVAGTYTFASDFGSFSNGMIYSATLDKWLIISNL